ncbi:MAG: P-II family nitrogen regulator [Planctomycetota bacterium]|jgi:nitrogen regulatory protein PII
MSNKLVIIFLNRTELLEDVLEGFLEVGVSGATVIDSVGMGRILSTDVPIFAGIRNLFPGLSPDNKTILIVTKEDMVDNIIAVVEDVCGDLCEAGMGLAVVLPLDRVQGLRPGLKE